MKLVSVVLGAAALASATVPLAAQNTSENPRDYGTWTPEQWREAARLDIMAAYQQLVENHPGMFDRANPGFPAQLVEAREAGLAASTEVRDRLGYSKAMGVFSAVLLDGHAKISTAWPIADGDVREKWPGFVALWRHDRLVATTMDKADPLDGATIESCGGKPVRDTISHALYADGFRPNEAGQWWAKSSKVFFGRGEVGSDLPAQCTFDLRGGEREARTLEWQIADNAAQDFYRALAFPEAVPVGLHEPREGIFVIGLGTFEPDARQRAEYDRLYSEIVARRGQLVGARAVVLDMRGNGGGSSSWSKKLAELLWGDQAFASRAVPIVGIDWRASRDTISYALSMAVTLRKQGEIETADWLLDLHNKLEDARDKGEPLYREVDADAGIEPEPIASDFTTPVYVINWGGCASACLDANDNFKLFENTRLIGAPTSADSTYMEVRTVLLPNGPGRVVIPNKTWVGRQRGWGEVYQPDIAMTQVDWSTEAFLDRIEHDLAD